MTDLIFDRVFLSFGERNVLSEFSLTVPAGSVCVLMGASGSGKTSILKLAAGLLAPTRGTVHGGADVCKVSLQFHEPRLLPWLTAAENVNLVLSDGKATLLQARELLERVGLSDAVNLYPAELSGGMQQRVSLCRALAAGGDLLLLDEPFRGLDGTTRESVMRLVADAVAGRIPGCPARTLLAVTHDPEEAAFFTNKPVYIV